jgi:ATP adenylyltransferase
MNDERLWAPWRLSYIAGDRTAADEAPMPAEWRPGAEPSCFMCRAAARFDDSGAADRRLLVVARGEHAFAVLNRYPYNNGHLLVCPVRHVATLGDLTADERLEALATLDRFVQLYGRLIRAEAFNIGLNLGRVAGAGAPGHLHWHLVPRWPGDNNFMPVTADVRVISQSLDELWSAIRAGIDAELTGQQDDLD